MPGQPFSGQWGHGLAAGLWQGMTCPCDESMAGEGLATAGPAASGATSSAASMAAMPRTATVDLRARTRIQLICHGDACPASYNQVIAYQGVVPSDASLPANDWQQLKFDQFDCSGATGPIWASIPSSKQTFQQAD